MDRTLGGVLVGGLALGCVAVAGHPASPGAPVGANGEATPTSTTGTAGTESSAGITVPDVMGMHRPQAEAALRAAGVRGNIVIDQDTTRLDMTVATVCSEVPGGGHETSASLDVVLGFCVHDAHDDESIDDGEDLVTMAGDAAEYIVKHDGFTVKIVLVTATETCKPGRVCAVSPVHWNHDKKHPVTLTVAK